MRCRHVRGLASRLFSIFALLAAISLPAFSQTLGQVTGRITDATGGAVAGATVTLVNVSTNAERSTMTTGDGDYTFPSVPPGVYSVKAAHPTSAWPSRTASRCRCNRPSVRTLRSKLAR